MARAAAKQVFGFIVCMPVFAVSGDLHAADGIRQCSRRFPLIGFVQHGYAPVLSYLFVCFMADPFWLKIKALAQLVFNRLAAEFNFIIYDQVR
jgi:hypothetical protein